MRCEYIVPPGIYRKECQCEKTSGIVDGYCKHHRKVLKRRDLAHASDVIGGLAYCG